jgi:hypothetical protein
MGKNAVRRGNVLLLMTLMIQTYHSAAERLVVVGTIRARKAFSQRAPPARIPGVRRLNLPDVPPRSRNSPVEQPDMSYERYELVLMGVALLAIFFIGLLYYQSFKRERKWKRRIRRSRRKTKGGTTTNEHEETRII